MLPDSAGFSPAANDTMIPYYYVQYHDMHVLVPTIHHVLESAASLPRLCVAISTTGQIWTKGSSDLVVFESFLTLGLRLFS
jgi:uncharacterized protein YqcC (DUF446 family)